MCWSGPFCCAGPAGRSSGRWPMRSSMWVFFSTLFVHRLGVALVRDSMTTHGRAGLRRAWPAAVILIACRGRRLADDRAIARRPPDQPSCGTVGRLRRSGSKRPRSAGCCLPFRIPAAAARRGQTLRLAAAPVARADRSWRLHLVWVIRADRAFEEAAIEASARTRGAARALEAAGGRSHQDTPSSGAERGSCWRPSGHPVLGDHLEEHHPPGAHAQPGGHRR